MISAIRPVSMTVLPPVQRTRRPVGALAALPPPAAVGAQDGFVRTVEHTARVERDGATAGRAARSVADPVAGAGLTSAVSALGQDEIIALHAFAETRGLTLNRHPQAAGAYDRAQALVDGADRRFSVSV